MLVFRLFFYQGRSYRGDLDILEMFVDITVNTTALLIREGYGQLNGFGRGINSQGEVYQGMFSNDEMDGHGFYYWPDGRIYEGYRRAT